MELTTFSKLFPKASAEYYHAFETMVLQYSITNLVMFLSQISVESGRLTTFKENLNYSAKRLQEVWPSRFTPENAPYYANNPERLANSVYANRLGNGNEASGDGWKFIGRGAIQLTGRNNYTKFTNYISADINQTPTYLETPYGAIESACWFWTQVAKVETYALRTDVPTVTKRVTGGLGSVNARYAEFDRVLQILDSSQIR